MVKVLYDFPKGNPHPFTADFEHNYFVHASGYSNLGRGYDFQWDDLVANVPMGYKSLIICFRVCLIAAGKVRNDWSTQVPGGLKKGNFLIYASRQLLQDYPGWGRSQASHGMIKPGEKDGSYQSHCWGDIKDCERQAKALSKQHECQFLIAKEIDFHNWH